VALAVRRVARLAPAEAMRPAAPGDYRPAWLERLGAGPWLGWAGRMVLRQIARRPLRAVFTTTGIALAIAVMILGSFGRDMIGYVIAFQFGAVQRYDFSIGFYEAASPAALAEVARLPGVLRAEPFRTVPVRLVHGARARRTSITGLAADRYLLQVLDAEERPVPLPESGLLLSEKLAEHLGVRPGGRVTVEVLEGPRPVREVEVTATMRDFSGLAAYMDRAALHRVLREGPRLSGALLAVDAAAQDALYRQLKRTPRVASVVSQRASLRRFEAMMEANLLRMRLVNVIFASIIAFGVVYNAARVTLSERAWELATLRVIGLTRGEVSATLAGEILLLTVWAAPLGLACGTGLAALALRVLETETQRFPLVIAPATYGAALVTVLVATVGSLLVVRRRINHLDLVGVLKARD
jgi:putative ABC transport system permease protein